MTTKSLKYNIPVLSPHQVKSGYLKEGHFFEGKANNDLNLFNIVKTEELLPFIKFPNPPFRNTSHGFIFVQKGSIIIQLDAWDYTLNKNDFILTPAGQINSFKAVSKDAKGFMGTFADHFFDNAQLSSGMKTFSSLLNPEHLPHFTLDHRRFLVFSAVCERLFEVYSESGNTRINLIQNYLWTLLSELEVLFKIRGKISLGQHSPLVLDFKQLLFKNIRNNPKPSELAASLNVTVNHLNKVLKENTQYSTTEWISKRLLIEAQVMLKYSNLSVAEIAYALGFDDPSYFSKFFARHAQCTPSQYRND